MDKAIIFTANGPRVGYFRVGAFRDDWDRLVKRVESVSGPISTDVTRRKLTLGNRDSTTGWCAKSYTESTIEMLVIPRSASRLAIVAGTYVNSDSAGLTADVVVEGDEIKTASSVYYQVMTVKEHYLGDSFSHRECQLNHLPLHE